MSHQGQINGVTRRFLGDWSYVVIKDKVWVREEGTGRQFYGVVTGNTNPAVVARQVLRKQVG